MDRKMVKKIIAKLKEIYKYDEINWVGGQYIVSYDYDEKSGAFTLRSVKWRGEEIRIIVNQYEVMEIKGNEWTSKVVYVGWEGLLGL